MPAGMAYEPCAAPYALTLRCGRTGDISARDACLPESCIRAGAVALILQRIASIHPSCGKIVNPRQKRKFQSPTSRERKAHSFGRGRTGSITGTNLFQFPTSRERKAHSTIYAGFCLREENDNHSSWRLSLVFSLASRSVPQKFANPLCLIP